MHFPAFNFWIKMISWALKHVPFCWHSPVKSKWSAANFVFIFVHWTRWPTDTRNIEIEVTIQRNMRYVFHIFFIFIP